MSWKIATPIDSSQLLKIHKDELKFYRKELEEAHPALWAEFQKQCLILKEHNEYRAHMEYLQREYPEFEIIPLALNDIWCAFSHQAFIVDEYARQVGSLPDIYRFSNRLEELKTLRFKAEEALDVANTLRQLREEADCERDYIERIDVHVDGGEEEWRQAHVDLERLEVKVLLAELNLHLLRESCLERLFEIEKEIESLVACSLDLLITEEPEIEVELVLENGSTLVIEGEDHG